MGADEARSSGYQDPHFTATSFFASRIINYNNTAAAAKTTRRRLWQLTPA